MIIRKKLNLGREDDIFQDIETDYPHINILLKSQSFHILANFSDFQLEGT